MKCAISNAIDNKISQDDEDDCILASIHAEAENILKYRTYELVEFMQEKDGLCIQLIMMIIADHYNYADESHFEWIMVIETIIDEGIDNSYQHIQNIISNREDFSPFIQGYIQAHAFDMANSECAS